MMDPLDEISMNARAFSYDSIATEYATKVDNAPYNALYERPAMLELLPDLHCLRILDAGCGSGWYAGQLIARGARVTAIDASAAMVDYARARLERNADAPVNVELHVADLADRLPFDDASFDGVVSPLVLHYLRDFRPALKEMRRVLVPGGWLQFSTHHPAADAARFQTKNYFAVEHTVDHWDWVGRVEFFRRSLTEIVSSVIDSGFIIDRIVEPIPTAEFRRQTPDSWERLMNQPEFLIVKAHSANL
ncbi:MAG TPA: class I SAM-dependent methyltransferase [Gemmatimonadaceae bacterium]